MPNGNPTPESYVIENLFHIANKAGDDVSFKLNIAQAKLDKQLTGRDVIPKARQEGISSYYLARYAVKCMYKRNTRAVVISHESEATQRMLARVKYFLETMKGNIKPETASYSKNEITFPKTNSMFYIGTAGAKKFGRGDTVTDLHCSEVAFWDNPVDLLGGLFQAVPRTGEIGVESTGNGVGNYYHRLVTRAADGNSRFKLHFFNWQDFPEYTIPLTPEEEDEIMNDLRAEFEETDWKDEDGILHEGIVNKFNLTPGQVAFRREKLEELDFDLHIFKQEYPMTLDECFQETGRSLFQRINYIFTEQWKKVDRYFHVLEGHPIEGRHYLIGADVGGGTGGDLDSKNSCDNSVASIFDLETLEQVGEWVSNNHEPDRFGYKLSELGRSFNNAFITVESNNHGLTTIEALRNGKRSATGAFEHEPYPTFLLYRRARGARRVMDTVDLLASFGYNTNRKSKPYLIGKLRKFAVKMLTIHSTSLLAEMQSYIEHPDGSLGAVDGCKDDRVVAAALAIINSEKVALSTLPQPPNTNNQKMDDPFLLDNMIKRARSSGRFLIPSHTL